NRVMAGKKKVVNKRIDEDEDDDGSQGDDLEIEDDDFADDDDDDDELQDDGDQDDILQDDDQDVDMEGDGDVDDDDDDNDNDEDDKKLTSRQRGMNRKGNNHASLAPIPDMFGKVEAKKEMSEEQMQKKQELAQQRRIKKISETEAEMRDVVNSLLNRKEKVEDDSVVETMDFTSKKTTEYPKPIKCSAPGCSNNKRYNCTKNNMPVCTMECWSKVAN
ncbi:hypothetical protein SAMD00019534_024880, partial [Acytostelium subglobosum LB1]|uniref:hypothetical protein n=1 Tax=Acytostelium subglobosum LB1 TaxID=1410327 RepID=UPI000644A430